MALSRLAAEFAAEIKQHDWSDAPWRIDRAGHQREHDSNAGHQVLSPEETDNIRTNVMWVAAQVLAHADPNFDPQEFAAACGVSLPAGYIAAGLRMSALGGYVEPGTRNMLLPKPGASPTR